MCEHIQLQQSHKNLYYYVIVLRCASYLMNYVFLFQCCQKIIKQFLVACYARTYTHFWLSFLCDSFRDAAGVDPRLHLQLWTTLLEQFAAPIVDTGTSMSRGEALDLADDANYSNIVSDEWKKKTVMCCCWVDIYLFFLNQSLGFPPPLFTLTPQQLLSLYQWCTCSRLLICCSG